MEVWTCENSLSLKVERLICLPHPRSVKEELLCATGEWLLRSLWGSGNMVQCMNNWCVSPPLTYYWVCILKVCLFHAWLTFILAITCKGKWIINPQGLIELMQHIYLSLLSLFVSFPLWRLSIMFPFAVMYTKTNSVSAFTVFDANSLVETAAAGCQFCNFPWSRTAPFFFTHHASKAEYSLLASAGWWGTLCPQVHFDKLIRASRIIGTLYALESARRPLCKC